MGENLIQGGGGEALVWPLLALGILSVAFILERILYLHKIQIHPEEFLQGIKNTLRKSRLVEALTLCEESKTPASNVIKAALLNHDKEERKLQGAIQTVAHLEIPLLEKRIMALGLIAKIAPILGLLGTLVAGWDAFQDLQKDGSYANASAYAGYLTDAVVSTIIGFVVAIVSLTGKGLLSSRVKSIVHDLEWAANDIMQFLLHELPASLVKENGKSGKDA